MQQPRDLFRLVRLTASFPNLIYVVAFDRARVEQALTEDGTAGRSYLEKIIQVVVDLPAPSERILVQEIGAAIAATLRDVGRDVRFSGDLWPDVFFEVVRPLLRNMRDVNRYCMSARGTLRIVDGHVEAVDVLALEAVRVFMPGFFSAIVSNVSLLTKTAPSYGAGTSSPTVGDGMRAILDAAERTDVARAVIQRLFPAAQRFMGGSSYGSEWSAIWLKERRVANEEILRLYIEGVQGDALSAFLLAERAETLLTDAGRLDAFLSALSDDVLTGVVQQLEAFEGDFHREQVVPASQVLLNAVARIVPQRNGLYSLSPELIVTRVVLRLFKAVEDEGARSSLAIELYPLVNSLSGKFLLVTLLGYREGAGHQLIPRDAAEALEARWRQEVLSADPESLAGEWDLLRVLYWASQDDGSAILAETLLDPAVTVALLKSARSEASSQPIDSRAVRVAQRLAWDTLVSIEGDEATLLERIEDARVMLSREDPSLLELVDRYVSGWRPREFGDD